MSTAPLITLIDGQPATSLPAIDRGLQYGDGLFETIACRDGQLRFFDLHRQRLRRGCERLELGFTRWAELERDLTSLQSAMPAAAMIKILITRGDSLARGYGYTGRETPRRIVTLWPAQRPAETERAAGVALGIATTPVSENVRLAGIKHLGRLDSVLARAEAERGGWFDALLLAPDGAVACASSANVFVARGTELLTPEVKRHGVAGIIRSVVLREAPRLNIAAREVTLSLSDVLEADEVLLTNARIGVQAVTSILDPSGRWRARTIGPIGRRLAEHIEVLNA